LFERGLKPLSAIKDMIGSQATKGMHVLAKFAPHVEQCGIWGKGTRLKAFEGYPSACKQSKDINDWLTSYPITTWHADEKDALICALIAWTLVMHPAKLAWPEKTVSEREGWIFVPVDGLNVAE
jgi:hypothetical protein